MISRKSARLLTDIYLLTFSYPSKHVGRSYRALKADELYDFLYERDYDVWLLKRVEKYNSAYYDHCRRLLLGLQTGESFHTPNESNWKQWQSYGQAVLVQLAQDIIKEFESCTEDYGVFSSNSEVRRKVYALKLQLELDGYVYKEGRLYFSESSVIDETAEQEYLENLFRQLNLPDTATIKHHLGLSEEHYINGKWDDSISNSRKVLDAILAQVTATVYTKVNNKPVPAEMLKNATDIRNFLERQNLLTKVEREALDKNYGALSSTGGHPYIAEKDQARLMRHLALTFSQFVLLRYQGFIDKNP